MMKRIEVFSALAGSWQGTSKLQLSPSEPVSLSPSMLSISHIVNDKYLQLSYTWEESSKPQEGVLIIGYLEERELATAVWLDSGHTGDSFMSFQGTLDESGLVSLYGSYPASKGPDWGWRIDLHPVESDRLLLTMDNISPDGQAEWAVKGEYQRIV